MKFHLPRTLQPLCYIFSLLASLPAAVHGQGGHLHFSSRDSYYDAPQQERRDAYGRVHIDDPWYHPDHVYYYDGEAYPNHYKGFPYYYYDPRWYYDGAPGLHTDIGTPEFP